MKTFEDICKMTQMEVKSYMKEYLGSKGYATVSGDGYLYAKGTIPVLLVAHMDTVHKEQCKEIVKKNGEWSSPQGIGGDDRCGVFIIMNLVKDLHCSVLLCEDEEIGTVGARKFTKTKHINELDVNYMIEFDRKGNNDAVFYTCDNKEFTNFVEDFTGFRTSVGSFSDISVLMPAAKLAAVNLSCGYYKAHTTNEYVVYDEMMDTIEAAAVLIKEEVKAPFKYIERKYAYTPSARYIGGVNVLKNHDVYDDYDYYGNMFDGFKYRDEGLYNMAKKDKECELEVIVSDLDTGENVLYATGISKAECWMNLFLDNPDLCFNNIVDFTWC